MFILLHLSAAYFLKGSAYKEKFADLFWARVIEIIKTYRKHKDVIVCSFRCPILLLSLLQMRGARFRIDFSYSFIGVETHNFKVSGIRDILLPAF